MIADLSITLATPDQAALVRRIMLEAFAEHATILQPPSSSHLEAVEDVVRDMAKGGAVLAWHGPVVVGSARFQSRPDHMYVQRVSVLPECRRRGIARAMMTYLEDVARDRGHHEIRVAVRESLPSNVRLYQSLGYAVTDKTPHPRGPDMVVSMAKRLV